MKLTKEVIDKVRHIEGFPNAKDEDIIELSNPPYYTACPNPFIEDFIKEHGKPYDEATDTYHREPFAFNVSEGKNDPLYNAHGYHTKVPYKAIMRYLLHYTMPGDIIFDGFSGSGMTGVAAQMCGNPDSETKLIIDKEINNVKWGERKAILNDLSPEASFLSYNFNTPINIYEFEKYASKILKECAEECNWMYETNHNDSSSNTLQLNLKGIINYVVWSDVYICPNCGKEIIYWDIAVQDDGKVLNNPKCNFCGMEIQKTQCNRAEVLYYDKKLDKTVKEAKQVPVKIFYTVGKTRYSKIMDNFDLELIKRIENMDIPYWYPTDDLPNGFNTEQPKKSHGYYTVNQFYTKRNLYSLSKCFDSIKKVSDKRIRNVLLFWFSSIYSRSHKLNRYMPNHNRHVGPLSGTLYIPYFQAEINILNLLKDKLKSITSLGKIKNNSYITTQSTINLEEIPNNSIDYIFTDPPFGDNLNYSELNFIWESWLKIKTNNTSEVIVNQIQNKDLNTYNNLMTKCFVEYYRILKPNRWITIEFHNSKNSVWNAIQESLQKAGFIIADVRILDKQKGTTKQLSSKTAVQQDLVISAYKPKESFKKQLIKHAGNQQTAWDFIREHLNNLPKVVIKDDKIELISERQQFLLYDRMVIYHLLNALPVPLDAPDFYKGLDEKFIKRDGMYFLHDQVNEYDIARIKTDVEPIQMSLFVNDEKTAIAWLYQQLTLPQTYAELQPKFMQEIRSIDKFEKLPELSELLSDNFIQNESGKWYIPDVTKSGDLLKLREKKLLKEFDEYLNTKGKLKILRIEAVKAGFAKLWKDKNYKMIVKTAERLPESVIEEDDKILMYYDISLSRLS